MDPRKLEAKMDSNDAEIKELKEKIKKFHDILEQGTALTPEQDKLYEMYQKELDRLVDLDKTYIIVRPPSLLFLQGSWSFFLIIFF